MRYYYVQRTLLLLTTSNIHCKESYSSYFVTLSWDIKILEIFCLILNPLPRSVLEIKIRWQKIQIWKNNNKCTTRVQIRNIESSLTIKVQVRNIDSNLNSSPTRQKRAKHKSISIKKSEELFADFRNVIGYSFWGSNQISSLSKNNPVH